MNTYQLIDKFGELQFTQEPPVEHVDRVQLVRSFSESTLRESARIIRENPELAREMGVIE